jgi:hypothetical protein
MIVAFRDLVLRYFRYRELEGERIVAALHRGVPKHENPKASRGVPIGHGTGSKIDILGFGFSTISRTKGLTFGIKNPEVAKHDVPLEWGCGHTFRYFRVRLFGHPENKRSRVI